MNPRRRGFTLVELAIVLVILGLVAALVLPTLKGGILRSKVSQARATLQAVRDGVIGFAQSPNRTLPATLAPLGSPRDPWGQPIAYWVAPSLTTADLCPQNTTAGTFLTPEGQTVTNVAFTLGSPGPDFTADTAVGLATNGQQADDDLLLFVTLEHLQTILCTNRTGGSSGDPGALATWNTILANTAVNNSGPGNLGALVTPTSIVLGVPNGTTPGSSYGCVWFTGNLNATSGTPVCTSGNCTLGKGLRAYFTFTVEKVGSTLADGFTFAVVSALTNSHASCGGRGSALGYAASTFISSADDGVPPFVLPPKMGLEFDFYTSSGYNDPGSNQDHLALVYWGSNAGATDLDRGRDDLRHNFTPGDGSPPHPNWVHTPNQTYFNETGTVVYPVRLEMVRNATAGTYTTHVWFNCVACGDLTTSGLTGPLPPAQRFATAEYFNHTATMNSTWNALMNKVLVGWTQGTGGARQRVTLTNATFFFPE